VSVIFSYTSRTQRDPEMFWSIILAYSFCVLRKHPNSTRSAICHHSTSRYQGLEIRSWNIFLVKWDSLRWIPHWIPLDSACSIFVVVRADQDIAPVSHLLQWMEGDQGARPNVLVRKTYHNSSPRRSDVVTLPKIVSVSMLCRRRCMLSAQPYCLVGDMWYI